MDENKATANESTGMSWSGFIVGFIIGTGLFYLTIKLVSALMFSRTAA